MAKSIEWGVLGFKRPEVSNSWYCRMIQEVKSKATRYLESETL
jgi:hypothetical protein